MSTNENLHLPDQVSPASPAAPPESSPRSASAASPSSAPEASHAALIATFYYQHDLARPLTSQEAATRLIEHVIKKLDLKENGPDLWQNLESESTLYRFESRHRAAHDTTVVQLALNAEESKPAAVAWALDLWLRLQAVLIDQAWQQGLVGYTLIYQAALSTSNSLNRLILTELLPDNDSRMLHFRSLDKLRELAITDSHHGRMWLVDIPIQNEGLQAATIYVALCPKEANDEFVRRTLLGSQAELFLPDLIAHKSYHQIRDYRRLYKKIKYGQKLETMRQVTVDFLDTQKVPPPDKFEQLRRNKRALMGGVALLDVLSISLAKQLHNYQPYIKKAKEGDMVSFHHGHIESAVQELKLKVDEGQTIIQATETTVNLIESGLQKAEDIRQQVIALIVAVFGVALAAPQLIDREAAGALWAWGRGTATNQQIDLLQLVGIQFLMIVILAIIVVVLLIATYNEMRQHEKI